MKRSFASQKKENLSQTEDEKTHHLSRVSKTISIRKYLLIVIITAFGCVLSLLWITNFLKKEESAGISLAHSEEEKKTKELKAKSDTLAAIERTSKLQTSSGSTRPLILYSHYETPTSRTNAVFFIQHGLHSEADFIFIINGESDLDTLLPTDNPHIRVVKKSNSCYDLGSHAQILSANDQELVKKHKRFILMNSSVRGPFLPSWAKGCWSDMFLDKLNDQVKLVGTTYNCWADHLQSMVLATDNIGIKILLKGDDKKIDHATHYMAVDGNPLSLIGLSKCPETKFEAVSAEVSLTQLIKNNNYSTVPLMTAKFANKNYDCENNGYNLASVHPYEVIFIKAREGWENSMDRLLLKKMTHWHDLWDYSSWNECTQKL